MNEKEFTVFWSSRIASGLLKHFPDDFLNNCEAEDFELPGIELILGDELFGKFEVLDTKKNSILLTNSLMNAKYLLYANRKRPKSVKMPIDEIFLVKIVKEYENHLDQLIKQIESDYNTKFPKSKNSLSVINEIFNSLNLKRY